MGDDINGTTICAKKKQKKVKGSKIHIYNVEPGGQKRFFY